MNFLEKIRKFMYGRYGSDELYKFLLYLYIVVCIINLFIKSSIMFLLELVVLIIIFYRIFSKDIAKRKKENQKFLKFQKKIKEILKEKRNDKEHIYKKCNKCKTTLKLPIPSKRGIKYVKCPKCKKRLTLLILKKEKIEIIKNGKKIKCRR